MFTDIIKKGSYLLAILALVGSPLTAEEQLPQQTEESDRYLSDEEYQEIQEQRLAEEGQESSNEVVSEDQGEDETVKAGCFACHDKKYLYKGIFQYALWFAADDSAIQLQDGTIWQVAAKDIPRIHNWKLNNDRLYVTPNRWYFSSFRYEIVNADTDQKIEANRISKPTFNTHQIKIIDYDHNRIALSEGFDIEGRPVYSEWKVSSYDHDRMNKWLPDDVIMVGANVGISSYSHLYVLINVETGMYVWATFVGMFR